MKIYVDADACPVTSIIISEASNFQLPVVLVKSYAHFSTTKEADDVEVIYVDTGSDSADYRILKLARENDLIVTQDYGLASLLLGKNCTVLHHKGFIYSLENIDQLLTTRHANAKARKSGYRTKGPKAMTDEDREKFRDLLVRALKNAK